MKAWKLSVLASFTYIVLMTGMLSSEDSAELLKTSRENPQPAASIEITPAVKSAPATKAPGLSVHKKEVKKAVLSTSKKPVKKSKATPVKEKSVEVTLGQYQTAYNHEGYGASAASHLDE